MPESTRFRVVLVIETAIPEDIQAESLVELHTILDVGDGHVRVVGEVVKLSIIGEKCK